MCNRYRTKKGEVRAGEEIDLENADGLPMSGKWAGSATSEKLSTFWLTQTGSILTQTVDEVTEISETATDDGELQWTAAPPGTRLLFVLQTPEGKDYRLAKLITTTTTPDQAAYFRCPRFPLMGKLKPGAKENIAIIPPLPAPPPKPRRQPELFS